MVSKNKLFNIISATNSVSSSFTVTNGGSGYNIGDLVSPTGGVTVNGIDAVVQVVAVSGTAILGVGLVPTSSNTGVYSTDPTPLVSNPVSSVTGSGSGAEITFVMEPSGNILLDPNGEGVLDLYDMGHGRLRVPFISPGQESGLTFDIASMAYWGLDSRFHGRTGNGESAFAMIEFDVPLAVKGDLLVRNNISQNVAFPAGTDDYVLTSDSSSATNLKWAPIPTPLLTRQDTYDSGPQVDLASGVPLETLSFEQQLSGSPVVVANGGTGYALDDILTVSTGTSTEAIRLIVTGEAGGVISAVEPVDAGNYTVIPANPVSVTGGTGNDDATFNLTFQNKNFVRCKDIFTISGGLSIGQSGALPSYAICDLGTSSVGDERGILIGQLTNDEEARLVAKSPLNSVFWYNSDLSRFRTIISGVAKSLLIEDDVPPSAYGEAYFNNNATQTTFLAANTPVMIEGAYNVGEINGFTANATGLQKDTAGIQLFSVNGSLSCRAGGLINKYNFYIAIDGVVQAKTECAAYLTSSDSSVRNPDVIGFINIDQGEEISIYVENSAGTQFMLAENVIVNVVLIKQ